jgi:predicted GNAT family acetyltransferase
LLGRLHDGSKNRGVGAASEEEVMFSVRRLSVEEFVNEVVPILAEREVENNLLLGLAQRLSAQPEAAADAVMCAVSERGRTIGGAVWTPKFLVVVSPLPPGAAPVLTAALLEHNPSLDGACGPGDHGRDVAQALAARHGGRLELCSDEILYALTSVVPPARPKGASHVATEAELPIVTDFMQKFVDEVRLPHPVDAEAMAKRKIADRYARLWDDDGPKSLACQARSTLTGAALAPVYTPPSARGRGYASALTADLCQSLLDSGRRFVCLHADRTNPTSNRIYQNIGFRPAGEFRVWTVR